MCNNSCHLPNLLNCPRALSGVNAHLEAAYLVNHIVHLSGRPETLVFTEHVSHEFQLYLDIELIPETDVICHTIEPYTRSSEDCKHGQGK